MLNGTNRFYWDKLTASGSRQNAQKLLKIYEKNHKLRDTGCPVVILILRLVNYINSKVGAWGWFTLFITVFKWLEGSAV